MSFGSGSIPGYLERLRKTKIRRANRQKEFKGGNDYSKVKNVKTEYNLPKFTRYNFSEFKKKVKEEAKLESIKRLQFWGTIIIVVLITLIIFNYF